MLCLVVVMSNYNSLNGRLPLTKSPPWLARFLFSSAMFNFVAMIEQVDASDATVHASDLPAETHADYASTSHETLHPMRHSAAM